MTSLSCFASTPCVAPLSIVSQWQQRMSHGGSFDIKQLFYHNVRIGHIISQLLFFMMNISWTLLGTHWQILPLLRGRIQFQVQTAGLKLLLCSWITSNGQVLHINDSVLVYSISHTHTLYIHPQKHTHSSFKSWQLAAVGQVGRTECCCNTFNLGLA